MAASTTMNAKVKKEGPGLCRCCLSEDGSFRDLAKKYVWMDKPEIYVDMLRECFNINLCQYSEGPLGVKNIICDVCVILLRDAFHFKKQVLTSERKFTDIMCARREHNGKVAAAYEADLPLKFENIYDKRHSIEMEHQDCKGYFEPMEPNVDTESFSSNLDCEFQLEERRVQTVSLSSGKQNIYDTGIQRQKQTESSAIQPLLVLQDNGVLVNSSGDKTFLCNICGKSFNQKFRLTDHQLTHSGIKSFVCDVCGKSFYTSTTMKRHVKDFHSDTKCVSKSVCKVCGRTVKDMKKHLVVHSSATPFVCSYCNKSFKRNFSLIQHLQTHSDKKSCSICPKSDSSNEVSCIHSSAKPFVCDICGKCFALKNFVRRHISYIHNNTKKFTCDVCGIVVTAKSTLEKHLLCHNTQKPFHCKICKKSFKIKEYLKQHISYVHSVAKRVSCDICGKTLKMQRNLKEHMIQVHGGARPFACHICGKMFKLKVIFNDHLLQHSKPRPHVCSICGKDYRWKSDLNKHLRQQHKKDKID